MNLIATAEEMRQQLELTGQPQERTITHAELDRECQLLLRYGPIRQSLQVLTIIEGRQPPQELRHWLRTVFTIPAETKPAFDYQKGFGIMKLTWRIEPPPQPVQARLFDVPDPVATEAYFQL